MMGLAGCVTARWKPQSAVSWLLLQNRRRVSRPPSDIPDGTSDLGILVFVLQASGRLEFSFVAHHRVHDDGETSCQCHSGFSHRRPCADWKHAKSILFLTSEFWRRHLSGFFSFGHHLGRIAIQQAVAMRTVFSVVCEVGTLPDWHGILQRLS